MFKKIDLQESLKILYPNFDLNKMKKEERLKLIDGFFCLQVYDASNLNDKAGNVFVDKRNALCFVKEFINQYKENLIKKITEKRRKLDQEYRNLISI